MTWKDSEGKATVYKGNGAEATIIDLDKAISGSERYFVVGCFHSGSSSFTKIGQAYMKKPDAVLANEICDTVNQNGRDDFKKPYCIWILTKSIRIRYLDRIT